VRKPLFHSKFDHKIQLILLVAGILPMGCGVSPILHHESVRATDPQSAQTGNCPLQFVVSGYCASLTWQSTPSDQGSASFTLKFWKAEQESPQGPYADPTGSVYTKLWMPSMGHGSSPVTLTHSQDSSGNQVPGVFQGSDVYFIMPGAWDVHVQILNGAQVSEEAVVSLTI